MIEYPLPTLDIAEQVIRNRLATLDTKSLAWPSIITASQGLSHAELVMACEQAAKETILRGARRVTTKELVSALEERRRAGI
jgi:ATP-dependent 26S proteasome regulatory subunit